MNQILGRSVRTEMKPPISRIFSSFLAVGVFFATAGIGWAATPGAWEKFATSANARAWWAYDPLGRRTLNWNSTPGNEHIWAYHDGDRALQFSAAQRVANGALVGNFAAANVGKIACDIFIEDRQEFDSVDCGIFTKGADGMERWYYSSPFFREDFTGDGWWEIAFRLDQQWYYRNGNQKIWVTPGQAFLSSVKEVTITFFPKIGSTAFSVAAIDNFVLEPKVTPPKITTSKTATAFKMAFTPAPGLTADVQQMAVTAPFAWTDVTGQTFISGPAQHVFSTPLDAPKKIFRVKVFPEYVSIVTAP